LRIELTCCFLAGIDRRFSARSLNCVDDLRKRLAKRESCGQANPFRKSIEMKSLKIWRGLTVLMILTAVTFTFAPWGKRVSPAAEEKAPDLQTFMRKKLDASSQILEGLAVEDHALIHEGATKILEMSKVEMWNVLTDSDYREFNREFRSAIRKLDDAATEKNFDGALLQWMDAMKGCVECHKYVRSQRPQLKKH
jgi:hypothetical protein